MLNGYADEQWTTVVLPLSTRHPHLSELSEDSVNPRLKGSGEVLHISRCRLVIRQLALLLINCAHQHLPAAWCMVHGLTKYGRQRTVPS